MYQFIYADENDNWTDDNAAAADDDDNVLHIAVKTKFAYAYTTEFPYRMSHIFECEFFLLEAMVIVAAGAVYCVISATWDTKLFVCC